MTKLPLASPGEQAEGFPHGRLVALEKAVAILVTYNKELMEKLDVVVGSRPAAAQENTPNVASIVPAYFPSLPPPLHSRPPPEPQASHARHAVDVNKPHVLRENQPSVQTRAQSNAPVTKPNHPNDQSSMPAAAEPVSWSVATRRRPIKVIRGTATVASRDNNDNRVGWTSAPRDLFVYHTSHHTTANDISDLMTVQSKVVPITIEKRSKEFAYFGSFRVTVRRDDFEESMKAEHWPAGWSIREYFVSRQRREVERLEREAAADGSTVDRMNSQLTSDTEEKSLVNADNTSSTPVLNNDG